MWHNVFKYIISVYKDVEGQPFILPVVKIAENILANGCSLSGDYAPAIGYESLSEAATRMLLGADSPAIIEKRVSIFLHDKMIFQFILIYLSHYIVT